MAEFKEYARPEIMINGVDIFDAQSIQFGNEENDNEIYTVAQGFRGISLGTEIFRATVEEAVQKTGLELNLTKLAKERIVVKLSVFIGDQSLTTEGYIKNVSYSGSVDAPASASFEFYGLPAHLS